MKVNSNLIGVLMGHFSSSGVIGLSLGSGCEYLLELNTDNMIIHSRPKLSTRDGQKKEITIGTASKQSINKRKDRPRERML